MSSSICTHDEIISPSYGNPFSLPAPVVPRRRTTSPAAAESVIGAKKRRRAVPAWVKWFGGGTLAVLVSGAALMSMPAGGRHTRSHAVGSPEQAVVLRSTLKMTVECDGVLESSSNTEVLNNVEWPTKIVSLVPPGTRVAKGDVICELDPSGLRTKLDEYRASLTRAEAGFARAKEEYEIQKMRNERMISTAAMQADLAELELAKFKDAEADQKDRQLLGACTIAEAELNRSQANYDFTRRLLQKGYSSQSEVEQARINMIKSEIQQDIAENNRQFHAQYTSRTRLAQLESTATQRRQELERVKMRAHLALLQSEVSLKAHERSAAAHRTQFERIERNIADCTIRAPRAGDVVYAELNRGNDKDRIQVGTDVRNRQTLIELPDLTRMQVDVRIHESRISLLSVGLPVAIRLDAMPNEVIRGRLVKIGQLPVDGEWPNDQLRFYEAVVEVPGAVDPARGLKPGLTAKVAIEVASYDKVLQVPVEAVTTAGTDHEVVVLSADGPERRRVLLGRSNDRTVEVLEGVLEGETVALHPEGPSDDSQQAAADVGSTPTF
jgi:multidrug efflux pump subunit AcrA (membrane-fusion protein)